MATIYRVDGSKEEVTPEGAYFDLQYLQSVVGGYIEIVGVGDDLMVLNEEGKIHDFDINVQATEIFQSFHGPIDVIVGDVIIGTPREMGGEYDDE